MFNLMPFSKRRNEIFNPFREFDYFNQLSDQLFKDFPFNDFYTNNNMPVDIKDLGDSYEINANLAGVKKEDIFINLNNEILTIKIEKNQNFEDKSENYLARERYLGSYQRSFRLEDSIKDSAKAKFENGVLNLVIKKSKENKLNSNQIKID